MGATFISFAEFESLPASDDVAFEIIQADLPELTVMLQPDSSVAQGLRFQPQMVRPAEHFTSDQAGTFQYQHVLGNGVERDREWTR
jgi:hypothetical protein